MDLEKMTVSEMFDMSKTEEGQEVILEAFKKEIEVNETFKRLLNWLGNLVINEGAENVENKLDNLSKFVDTLSLMTEEEATKYINEIVDNLFSDEDITEEQKEEMVSQLSQNYRKPDKLLQSLTKVTERAFDGKTFAGKAVEKKINVATRNKKPVLVPVKIYTTMITEQGESYLNVLKPYDREVFNGYCTILSTGQNLMTAKQIYEAINGKPTTSPQAIEAINNSMRKMQTTLLDIDWTQHAILNGINLDPNKDKLKTEEPIIPFRKVTFVSGGKEVVGYQALSVPALYVYSNEIRQISTTDKKILQVPDIQNTEENTVIRNRLISKVEHMKNNKKWSRTITFKNLFEECDISGDKKKMSNKRDVIFSILDYWKDINYITDYEIIKKGRVFESIKIMV